MGRSVVNVAILGSTGTIGRNTLDVITRHPDKYQVIALTAHRDVERMRQQIMMHRPTEVVMVDTAAAEDLRQRIVGEAPETTVLSGQDALTAVVDQAGPLTVVTGIVGAAGLPATLAAVESGHRVLVANKEPFVMMGQAMVNRARSSGAEILPLDSEHNAIFQCLPGAFTGADGAKGRRQPQSKRLEALGVRRLVLTASGGPFLRTPAARLRDVTPAQAIAHPNWTMGRKISIDSATLMNKGLELIEACALFEVPPQMIEVVVHPQSLIHSMVEYVDGSVLAQMAAPDMRVPIANALAWPERQASGADFLSLTQLGSLEFEAPDMERFPSLKLARQAAEQGGTAPSILNAANEIAVDAFSEGKIPFTMIPEIVDRVLQDVALQSDQDLETVLAADALARTSAREYCHKANNQEFGR